MTRGLSRQQFKILLMLQTKKIPRSDRGHFSTQEVVAEFHPDYVLWLMKVEQNPFVSSRKHHIDYPKFDKIRVSVYRALRGLERRGLIVSFCGHHTRFWAVPERLGERERRWVEQDREEWENRRLPWVWAAFIRTLPRGLHLKYKLRIPDPEDWEKIKSLWYEYSETRGIKRKNMLTR